jgi:hypothetical protein
MNGNNALSMRNRTWLTTLRTLAQEHAELRSDFFAVSSPI